MSASLRILVLPLAILALIFQADIANAAATAAQKRQLLDASKKIRAVRSMILRKQYEDATKALDEAEATLKKLVTDKAYKEDDRAITNLVNGIKLQRANIAKGMAASKPAAGTKKGSNTPTISFKKDVAPIFAARCANCHGNRNSGGLKLDTFAAMKKGGSSGALLVPGNPPGSLLMRRVLGGNNRMPRGGQPLGDKELETLAEWIREGARFDGDDENAKVDAIAKASGGTTPMPVNVKINKATGNEKVSFINDIAPTIVNLCIRCHGGNNPNGGLNLTTFAGMMRGGKSGRVVLPGDLEGSRLWRLVGGLEAPRMPQGQARITRTFYNNLKLWFQEGAKYDGDDANARLRDIVPTEEEKRAMELAQLTPEEFESFREQRTDEIWQSVYRRETARYVKSREFYVYGNVEGERLQQIDQWAEEYATELRKAFSIDDEMVWRGRLTIFVVKDRFGYTEFNQSTMNRETPGDMIGHSVITPVSFEDAYIVLQEIGDADQPNQPSMHVSLIDNLTGAFLKRSEGKLPDWVVRGTGLAMAAKTVGESSYISGLKDSAIEALAGLTKPEEVFVNGKFSPSQIGPVGYSVVDYMLKVGGPSKYGKFITSLQGGSRLDAALNSAYKGASAKALAAGYAQSLQK